MKIVNICSLILIFFSVSCSKDTDNENKTTDQFLGNAMTIDYKIIIGKKLEVEEKNAIQNIITETFDEVNSTYNKWNSNSEISRLNRMKKGRVTKISGRLEKLLKETEQMVILSDGRFDPTINSLQKLWKKHLIEGSCPLSKDIEKQMEAVGWDKIHVQNGTFYKDHDKTTIDLGGIAKGLTVDLLVSRLNFSGYPDVFVEWGGEIKASGIHPDNRPWRIFISRLGVIDPEQAITHLDLDKEGISIATSGDYFQNWTVKKNDQLKTYFHIFDPKLGKPLEITKNSIASASVLAHSCLVADAVATILMLFSDHEEAIEWAKKVKLIYPEMQFWIVTRSHASE